MAKKIQNVYNFIKDEYKKIYGSNQKMPLEYFIGNIIHEGHHDRFIKILFDKNIDISIEVENFYYEYCDDIIINQELYQNIDIIGIISLFQKQKEYSFKLKESESDELLELYNEFIIVDDNKEISLNKYNYIYNINTHIKLYTLLYFVFDQLS